MKYKVWVYVMLLMINILLTPLGAAAFKGGPDRFGYSYADSDETSGPSYAWENISFKPSQIGPEEEKEDLENDELSDARDIGFTFEFYGNKYDKLYISSNGFVSFDQGWGNGCCNGYPLPSTKGAFDSIIAGLWDDLNPGG